MADVAAPAPVAAVAKAKKAARKSGTAKPKKVSDHPKYAEMVKDALSALKERGGSSRQAILKYIIKQYKLAGEEKTINAHLKLALRAGVKNGSLKQSKGTGASGSFRLGEKTTEKKPKAAAKKPAVAKPKKPAAAAKKPKTAAKKATKAAGSPKKAAAKPKTAKPKAVAKPKAAAKPKSPKKVKAAKPAKAKSPKKAAKPKATKAKKVAKK